MTQDQAAGRHWLHKPSPRSSGSIQASSAPRSGHCIVTLSHPCRMSTTGIVGCSVRICTWATLHCVAPLLLLQITMGTFILSFIGNGFVESAQTSPVLTRFTPQVRACRAMDALHSCCSHGGQCHKAWYWASPMCDPGGRSHPSAQMPVRVATPI